MQLVRDWDGTVTERDTLDLVLSRFGDAEIYERAEVELERGTMTLNEVIATEFAAVTAPLDEVVAYVVAEALAEFHGRGIDRFCALRIPVDELRTDRLITETAHRAAAAGVETLIWRQIVSSRAEKRNRRVGSNWRWSLSTNARASADRIASFSFCGTSANGT